MIQVLDKTYFKSTLWGSCHLLFLHISYEPILSQLIWEILSKILWLINIFPGYISKMFKLFFCVKSHAFVSVINFTFSHNFLGDDDGVLMTCIHVQSKLRWNCCFNKMHATFNLVLTSVTTITTIEKRVINNCICTKECKNHSNWLKYWMGFSIDIRVLINSLWRVSFQTVNKNVWLYGQDQLIPYLMVG